MSSTLSVPTTLPIIHEGKSDDLEPANLPPKMPDVIPLPVSPTQVTKKTLQPVTTHDRKDDECSIIITIGTEKTTLNSDLPSFINQDHSCSSDRLGRPETQTRSSAPSPESTASFITFSQPSMSCSPSPSKKGLTNPSSTFVVKAPREKTPNVYVNGLPPRFPESHLLLLARSYGAVRSVRTFTRIGSGGESSGYGFILYHTVDEAERCIQGLKRSTTLVPSFSKQSHRITNSFTSSTAVGDLESDTFREKMEKLRDTTSTNLYFEGLPLSIDEPTLTALVSPHRIRSSRFFQTKLSDPPRIIAFVRFETRAAAEEIIDRLHGRMIRGWNDPGCRVSVRFADSIHQRELRRSANTGEHDLDKKSGLSITEANLSNLHDPGKSGRISAPRWNTIPGVHSSQADVPIDLAPKKLTIPPQFPAYNSVFNSIYVNHRHQNNFGATQPKYTDSGIEAHIMRNYIPRPNRFARYSRLEIPDPPPPSFDAYHEEPYSQLATPEDLLNSQLMQQQLYLASVRTNLRHDHAPGKDTLGSNHSNVQLNAAELVETIPMPHLCDSHLYAPTDHSSLCQLEPVSSNTRQRESASKSPTRTRSVTAPAQQFHNHNRESRELTRSHFSPDIRHGMPNVVENGLAKSLSCLNQTLHNDEMNSQHSPTIMFQASALSQNSPALTWASQTPSTLSPATPLFNAFAPLPDTDVAVGYGQSAYAPALKHKVRSYR